MYTNNNCILMLIRCQDADLGPSLPIHPHRHHYPGHGVCGLQVRHQNHSHLPGGLEEACTWKGNQMISINVMVVHYDFWPASQRLFGQVAEPNLWKCNLIRNVSSVQNVTMTDSACRFNTKKNLFSQTRGLLKQYDKTSLSASGVSRTDV